MKATELREHPGLKSQEWRAQKLAESKGTDTRVHHSAQRSPKAGHSERLWATSPGGVVHSTQEDGEPRWWAGRPPGKGSWPHRERPQNLAWGGVHGRDPIDHSVRTNVHRLRAEIHVEDRQCRHCCTLAVTERTVKAREDARLEPWVHMVRIGSRTDTEAAWKRDAERGAEIRTKRRPRSCHPHCSLKREYGERTAAVKRHGVQSSEEWQQSACGEMSGVRPTKFQENSTNRGTWGPSQDRMAEKWRKTRSPKRCWAGRGKWRRWRQNLRKVLQFCTTRHMERKDDSPVWPNDGRGQPMRRLVSE